MVPVLNDASFVETCMRSILDQDLGNLTMEVLVVDGMSTDGTRDILQSMAAGDQRLRLLDNPRQRVSPALNLGMNASRGHVLVRMDAHAVYDRHYVRRSWELLQESSVDAVGGRQKPLPGAPGLTARAIAAVQLTSFGLGGGAHRRENYHGPAGTLWLGAFHRDLFMRVGGFDEALFRSEDNDFYQRVRAAGGRLLISPDIQASYFCRSDLKGVARQSLVTGSEILPTMRRNARAMSLRHLAPGAALLALLSLPACLLFPDPWPLLLLSAAAAAGLTYVALLLTATGSVVRAAGAGALLPAMLAFPVIHLSYALGTLFGLVKLPGARQRAPLPKVPDRVA